MISRLQYSSINRSKRATKRGDFVESQDWYGESEEPLSGFSWRSGVQRDTTGVVFWNDVFLYDHERTGEQLAIFLIDTQGLFDNETSPTENSKIFALGSLISSLQIFNLFSMVQEDQLQYLQFATEYAKLAANERRGPKGKAFQNLLFLVRLV